VADRRLKARFEIVGRLPGSLAAERLVRVHNISPGGAMVETTTRLVRDTVFNVRLESDQHMATVRARVCHVRRSHLENGYLVGLEFVGAEPEDMDRLIPHELPDHVPGT
jgi:hypothetical protein